MVGNRFTAEVSIAAWAISRSSTARSLAQPVELALVALDRGCLVLGHGLAGQPVPPQPAKQIGVGAGRDEMSMQDRMHLVLDARPVPDDLVAPADETAQALRVGIR
jgi:hypothetical protein